MHNGAYCSDDIYKKRDHLASDMCPWLDGRHDLFKEQAPIDIQPVFYIRCFALVCFPQVYLYRVRDRAGAIVILSSDSLSALSTTISTVST